MDPSKERKREGLIAQMNPHWRDLISEWEEKYGLEFRLDGRITAGQDKSGWASVANPQA
jgi:hypothetical protein